MFKLNKLLKLVKLFKNRVTRKGLYNNIAANIELEYLVNDLKFETVIDVGSNKGQFILLVEKNFPNEKFFYSFEPITEILEKQKKFFLGNNKILFFNFALGEKFEKKKFNITKRKDSSSFFQINEMIKSKDHIKEEEREIEIKPLDKVIGAENLRKPILMKIDVQGYEFEVLKGSKDIIRKIKYLIIELSENEIYKGQSLAPEIIDYLKKINFNILKETRAYKISGSEFKQKDILFINHNSYE